MQACSCTSCCGWLLQGLRAFLASNESLPRDERAQAEAAGETWGVYPDDTPLHTLALQGDSRAALAPFLAHRSRCCLPLGSPPPIQYAHTVSGECCLQSVLLSRWAGRLTCESDLCSLHAAGKHVAEVCTFACRHFGDTYKWLLYGDDDTAFFLDAAINVLQHLDPDLPYFLTGEGAMRWAPGCEAVLPASQTLADLGLGAAESRQSFEERCCGQHCPCHACMHDEQGHHCRRPTLPPVFSHCFGRWHSVCCRPVNAVSLCAPMSSPSCSRRGTRSIAQLLYVAWGEAPSA